MSKKISELMKTPTHTHDIEWLKQSLQAAIELELATIPPYLIGLWSIKSQDGPAFDLIESVVLQEMLHMGLACNMLTGIGGTPQIVSGYRDIKYPGALPGGVRPNLTVYLAGLSMDYIKSVYMEIEFPQGGPIAFVVHETFPTIGAFYDAVGQAFQNLNPPIHAARQLSSAGVGLTQLLSGADVAKAINEIKEQGEGTSQSPEAPDFGSELAHYYRFAEIFHGRKLVKVSGKWAFTGDPIPFPEVYPVGRVPAGGYPAPPEPAKKALSTFNQQFADVLVNLDKAWATGNQAELGKGITAMIKLGPLATALMQIPRTDKPGVYGPDFSVS